MTIEEEIFKNGTIDFAKIVKYGFKKDSLGYKYSINIMNNTFRMDIRIDKKGIVKGKVYDLLVQEEYTNFRRENGTGSFINQVRNEFREVLIDIRSKCFKIAYFHFEQTNRIVNAIKEKYMDEPEFKWEKFPRFAIFRNKNNSKWYGIIMNIDKSKIDENSSGEVEIINLKLDPKEIEVLLKQEGFYKAYHMNKKSWITIILNDTLQDENVMNLVDKSYMAISPKK